MSQSEIIRCPYCLHSSIKRSSYKANQELKCARCSRKYALPEALSADLSRSSRQDYRIHPSIIPIATFLSLIIFVNLTLYLNSRNIKGTDFLILYFIYFFVILFIKSVIFHGAILLPFLLFESVGLVRFLEASSRGNKDFTFLIIMMIVGGVIILEAYSNGSSDGDSGGCGGGGGGCGGCG